MRTRSVRSHVGCPAWFPQTCLSKSFSRLTRYLVAIIAVLPASSTLTHCPCLCTCRKSPCCVARRAREGESLGPPHRTFDRKTGDLASTARSSPLQSRVLHLRRHNDIANVSILGATTPGSVVKSEHFSTTPSPLHADDNVSPCRPRQHRLSSYHRVSITRIINLTSLIPPMVSSPTVHRAYQILHTTATQAAALPT